MGFEWLDKVRAAATKKDAEAKKPAPRKKKARRKKVPPAPKGRMQLRRERQDKEERARR